jgi:phage terminase large subunit-like protein
MAPRRLTGSQAVIAFIEQYLVVPEGSHVGRPIRLRDWQKDILQEIYDTPTRHIIISMGRKNGKTAFAAMLVLVHLIGPEARRNGQIYSAAQSRDQASIVFGLAAKMVRMSDFLVGQVTVRDSAKELFCPLTGVRYKALSADATTAYGYSPVLVIHDELGQVRGERSELYDVLETAMGAQDSPLSVVISTQAPTALDLLSKLIDDAGSGDRKQKLILYAADQADDLEAEATWRKSNPALGDFLNVEEIRGMAAKAMRMPSFEARFRNLHLNQRVSALNQLFSPSIWDANGGEPDLDVFFEYPVYAGLDLSGKQDLTALVLVAKDAVGVVHVWPHFWTPADTLRDRAARDRAPYDAWARGGQLNAVPGVTIDYEFVARKIADIAGKCDLRTVNYDRWRVDDLKRVLEKLDANVPMEPHGQGFKDMAPAIDALEVAVLQKSLRHGQHPVLAWNAANAVVVADPAGNRKFDKPRDTARIDGMVALAMAVRAIDQDGGFGRSLYEQLAELGERL